jgi:glycerol-3-phosphate cytidylyltransferase-like family protein
MERIMIFSSLDHASKFITAHQTILTSGFFDPITVGHGELFKAARDICHNDANKYPKYHLVIINGNNACIKKKGYYFMDEQDRANILNQNRYIDYVLIIEASDVSSVIERLQPKYFLNAGDRTTTNANENELKACLESNCVPMWLGLPKIASSSELVERVVREYSRHMKHLQIIQQKHKLSKLLNG